MTGRRAVGGYTRIGDLRKGLLVDGKARVAATLRHELTDRPAYDFWAEEATLNRLYEHLGYADLTRFLDALDVDIREVAPGLPAETALGGGVYQNYWGERYVYRDVPYGRMRDDLPGALAGCTSMTDIASFAWPRNDDVDFTGLRAQCDAVAAKGYAIRYGFADVWQRPCLVRGWENAMLDMYEHPDWMHRLSRIFTDFYREDFRRAWEASGGLIDLFTIYSDLGTQRGPLISPAMFGEFVAPYLGELVAWVHHLGSRVLFHSCGDVSVFIPDLIRLGVDVLDPIQPANERMAPRRLARYGSDLCFHGGIDTQTVLATGTPAQVRARVRQNDAVFGSGYIVAPTHLFQPDAPAENIIAVYEAFA